ncbi:MAG TPA: hypothetical protein PKV33_07025 [Methanothrix sp.]|nr:hypothetical protein [Methanothrix sp.]
MVGAIKNAAIQQAAIDEIEMDSSEITELDKIAEEMCKWAIYWEDLKAELDLCRQGR